MILIARQQINNLRAEFRNLHIDNPRFITVTNLKQSQFVIRRKDIQSRRFRVRAQYRSLRAEPIHKRAHIVLRRREID